MGSGRCSALPVCAVRAIGSTHRDCNSASLRPSLLLLLLLLLLLRTRPDFRLECALVPPIEAGRAICTVYPRQRQRRVCGTGHCLTFGTRAVWRQPRRRRRRHYCAARALCSMACSAAPGLRLSCCAATRPAVGEQNATDDRRPRELARSRGGKAAPHALQADRRVRRGRAGGVSAMLFSPFQHVARPPSHTVSCATVRPSKAEFAYRADELVEDNLFAFRSICSSACSSSSGAAGQHCAPAAAAAVAAPAASMTLAIECPRALRAHKEQRRRASQRGVADC